MSIDEVASSDEARDRRDADAVDAQLADPMTVGFGPTAPQVALIRLGRTDGREKKGADQQPHQYDIAARDRHQFNSVGRFINNNNNCGSWLNSKNYL